MGILRSFLSLVIIYLPLLSYFLCSPIFPTPLLSPFPNPFSSLQQHQPYTQTYLPFHHTHNLQSTMMLPTLPLTLLTLLIPTTTAHFVLTWPPNRGFDDTNAPKFPCGGFDSVSAQRTEWPIKGGPIQLRMEHTQTRLKVFLALGDNPGTSFNVVLKEQFAQEGLGNFCIGGLSVPQGVNVTDGMSATLQVVSNGDPNGGLYQVRLLHSRILLLDE